MKAYLLMYDDYSTHEPDAVYTDLELAKKALEFMKESDPRYADLWLLKEYEISEVLPRKVKTFTVVLERDGTIEKRPAWEDEKYIFDGSTFEIFWHNQNNPENPVLTITSYRSYEHAIERAQVEKLLIEIAAQ